MESADRFAAPYEDSRRHVLAELGRLDLWIGAAVARARENASSADRWKGIYISDEEVDAILARPGELPRWALASASDPALAAALARLSAGIGARVSASLAAGVPLRLLDLAALADLAPFDVDALLVCLAPEIDVQYEKLFAYLHDDVTRRRPSVDLILNLLCRSLDEKLDALPRFFEDGPLRRHHLVRLLDEPEGAGAPLLARRLSIDPRIARFLLGSDAIDATIAPFARIAPSAAAPAGAALPARLETLVAQGAAGSVVHLHGPRGAGRKTLAQALCERLGLHELLVVDGERLAAAKEAAVPLLARLSVREASLRGAALYWDGFDALLADDRGADLRALLELLAEAPILAFLGGSTAWDPGHALAPRRFVSVEVPRPDPGERHQLWTAILDGEGRHVAGELPAIATHFRFTPGQVHAALASARDRARARGAAQVATEDLYAGCYGQADRRLGELAHKVPPRHGWDALVLPADPATQLRELHDRIRYRHHVMSAWGFEQTLTSGRCVTALLAGPSGTGKTMAAAILAGELGLDLYKVELSSVVSKYIGETEKNLARIFDAAETGHAILFFDEADALFGKRSEVKDAHDRYANIEVGYLLQRIEEHEGVVVLATNLRRNMDDAFVRRMSFAITFPFPEELERLRIWQGIWPAQTPRQPDIDFAFVAREFRLSGGNIRNAALAAAFFAAARGQPVGMVDVIRAIYRELQKMGKTPVPAEFGAHAALL